jgi:putative ABC transport system permease protein
MVLINETARDRLQLDDPVGKKLGGNEITGVIRDFHHNSFRKKISPMMLIKKTPMARTMMVKVKGEPDKAVLSDMGDVYRSVLNTSIFDYQFLSERFDELYKKERRLGIWLMLLSGIAIGISSMGLLGLTIFQARKRTREIAIRKVNGARVGHLMGLLSGNYLKLIVWAAAVSFPVSWWLLNLWLQNFAYQVDLSWGIFPGALMLAVVITLLTVGFQTYQAARANPADSLRYE